MISTKCRDVPEQLPKDTGRWRRVNVNDLQILHRDAVATHAAGHAHFLWHFVAKPPPIEPGFAFGVLLTVSARTAVETMALDHALEALAF